MRFRAAILVSLVLASGCSALTPAAAIVNGTKISEASVQEEMDRIRDDPSFRELIRQQGDEVRGQARRNVLGQAIKITFEQQQAHRRGIRVTGRDVDAFLKDITARLGGPARFKAVLAQNHLSMARARVLAERQLYEDDLQKSVTKDVKVDEAKITDAYTRNKNLFSEVHLQRITVATQAEAQQIADQAKTGDFAALAKQKSIDPAAAQGGDLGYQDVSKLDGALWASLDPVPVGGVSQPFRGQGGYEVYKMLDRRQKPLETVRSTIVDRLLQDERKRVFDAWLSKALAKARIVVNPKYGRFDAKTMGVAAGSSKLPE